MTRTRRGVALLVALCTITLVSALVVGALHAVGGLRRDAVRVRSIERARRLADRAVVMALAALPPVAAAEEGRSVTLPPDAGLLRLADDERVTVTVLALPGGIHRVAARAWAGEGNASAVQAAHALARLDTPAVTLAAGLAVDGPVRAADGWSLVGGDCPDDSGLAGVQLPDAALLSWQGAPPAGGVLVGAVPSASAVLAMLRPRAVRAIAAGASVVPGPRVDAAGRCDVAAADNWGDRTLGAACASHRPVVHAAGDLAVGGGAGQGVLLVEGTLTVTGPLVYAGLIVAGGGVRFAAPGSRLEGAIIAAGSLEASEEGVLVASRCRVAAALAGAAAWELVPWWGRARGW